MAASSVVAREPELAALTGALGRALGGQGQVRFLVGEAGSGKSSLLGEVMRQAQESVPELLGAVGQCDARTGVGDAYLPFREVLGALTGSGEASHPGRAGDGQTGLKRVLAVSGEAIAEFGPDLVGLLIPGADLLFRLGTFATQTAWGEKLRRQAERENPRPGLTQDQIFEQYTNVLLAMARQRPLLLVLDDLHWADDASLALLFRLGRRLEGSRILLIGTFRPDDVALGRGGQRHPLEGVLNELQRYGGDITLDLDAARLRSGRAFVDALLDQEPNALDEDFRQALHAHTGGHPLFVAELLRTMQERGDLILSAQGRWTPGAPLDWHTLPARVEAVIAERIGRLSDEFREALAVGAVEGEQFTAEVVARVRAVEARDLVRQLSGALDRQHHLVSALGLERAGTQRLARYGFRHGLLQRHLYGHLDEAERAYLHQDVGDALEALHGPGADTVAVQLAHHYSEAGDDAKARQYLRVAGQTAAARFANHTALDYLGRALALIPAPEAAERFDVLLARHDVLNVLGERDAQLADLTELEALAAGLDDRRRARVALAWAGYANATADPAGMIEAARRAEALASAAGDEISGIRAMHQWAVGLLAMSGSDTEEIRGLLDGALNRARAAGARIDEGRILISLGELATLEGNLPAWQDHDQAALAVFREVAFLPGEINALNNLGNAALRLGELETAHTHLTQALETARAIGDRRGQAYMLNGLGQLARAQADFRAALTRHQEAVDIARAIGDRHSEYSSLINVGVTFLGLGEYAAAREHLQATLTVARALGSKKAESYALNNLGELEHATGRFGKARTYYDATLELKRALNDRGAEGYILAYLGLLEHHQGDHAAAEAASARALEIARDLVARPEQASALTVRGHALAALNRPDEGATVYREALELRRALGQPHLATEPLAGLARVALAGGNLSGALDQVREVLAHLDAGGVLDGTDEPLRVWLTEVQVLRAAGDPRAGLALVAAHQRFQKMAATLPDDAARRDFKALPHHRELLSLWNAQ